MTEISDEILMEQVSAGDLQKAKRLFENYNRKLFSFFVRLTYDRDLSNDLTQNVFLRMLRYRKSYKKGSRFKPWIYQIARNTMADHFRKKPGYKSDFSDIESLAMEASEIHEQDEQMEREKILHKSLSLLPDDQREVLVLSRFQQMKYEEIAALNNTTVANVKIKVHRAIKTLRTTYFELEKQLG